jgi:isopentenyldiphosphate isomerase
MNEELFDVVNDRDEVIGRRPRREVHRLGLKHRAVHVLVFNQRGEVFLQKRSLTKDSFPGAWDSSASGHLLPGESYDCAALRELAEELGLRPERPPERLFKLAASPATDQEFVWVYRVEAEGPFTLHPEEISAGGWFPPEQVTRWLAERPGDFAGSVPLIWGRYRAECAGPTAAAEPRAMDRPEPPAQ